VDVALAAIAVVVLATVAALSGGGLQVPWDGIGPFAIVGAILLASSALVDARLLVVDRTRFARRQLRALRLWAPFAVVYLCYRALRGAIPSLVDGTGVEASLIQIDEALFGVSPAWWFERIHAPWLTELLAGAYATMFFLPLALMLVLHARARDRELRGMALSLQIAFYLGFTIFLLVPARSPDVLYVFPTELHGHGFYEASARAWRSLQAVNFDAFPSMHTAISTLALLHAYRLGPILAPRAPRLPFFAMLPVVVLLQVATLYLRQHYFIDVVAGWIVATLAITSAGGLRTSHTTPSQPSSRSP
jgi:membrane-associated phospholipid phosphatase